jgi:KipI family sensor histidine kinase inhibitor
MIIRQSGDTMLIVEIDTVIDPIVNERVIRLAQRLTARKAAGIRDVVPGYCTLGVHFDPLRTDLAALERAVHDEAGRLATVDCLDDGPVIQIPVSYGGEDGPDLGAVAEFAGLTPAQVVERHAARTYRVYMLGFVPGFAYMGRVERALAAPRHRVPRERVPAGSVGIAGEQTGVYPIETPGGWQLIGRTSMAMFDPRRNPPSALAPGDLVRFVAAGKP